MHSLGNGQAPNVAGRSEQMKLYVARHGETEWNRQNKVCGRTDSPLTEKGLRQAQLLADGLDDCPIDVIIASPLSRAQDTARVVAERKHLQVITDERLIEQDYGVYEGVQRDDLDFLNNKRMFAYRYPGGESMMDIARRTYDLIIETCKLYPDSSVLFVCHNGICRVICSYFNDMTNEEYFGFSQDNCGYNIYEC